MRISAVGVIDAVDPRLILEKRDMNTKENLDKFIEYCEMLENNPEYLPLNEQEELFDYLIATTAVETALKRHAGRIATEADAYRGYIPSMPMGRDLRMVDLIVGVGGIFSHNDEEISKEIIREALKDRGISLLPENAKVIIDKNYILFAAGNIIEIDPDYAMKMMEKELIDKQN
jgi:uncharacterized protein (TIGR01319 family)